MALTDIPKRFPLATLFGSLILVGAAGGVATGSDLANQLMSTIASAVVSMALLLGFIPDLARWRAPAVSTVRLAAGVVAVGALAAICSVVVSSSGANLFAYGGRSVASAWEAFGVGALICAATGVFEEALFRICSVVVSSSGANLFAYGGRSVASAWEAFGVGALICAATGVFEEALFRGLLVTCLYNQLIILNGDIVEENADGSRKTIPPMAFAALMGSVLFALLHVVGSPPIAVEGELAGFIVVTQIALKLLQAGMFGFCMTALMVRTGSVWLPVIAHTAFDLLYFAPALIAKGALPATRVTGNCGDLVVLALSTAVLVPLCLKSRQWMMGEVLPYTSNPKSR